MGTSIKINTRSIRSFKAQIDVLNGKYAFQSSFSFVDDDSATSLHQATQSMIKSSDDIKSAVEHLNDYLDKVADEFQAKDSELQAYLESGLKSESHYDNVQKRLSRLNRAVRDSKYYQVLPE